MVSDDFPVERAAAVHGIAHHGVAEPVQVSPNLVKPVVKATRKKQKNEKQENGNLSGVYNTGETIHQRGTTDQKPGKVSYY